MIGFESYQPSAWRDGVMIIRNEPVVTEVKRAPTRRQDWKVSLVSSVLSAGIAVMTVLVPSDAIAKPLAPHKQSKGPAMAGVVVSPSYWTDMVSQLRSAPALAAQSLENDPDPII